MRGYALQSPHPKSSPGGILDGHALGQQFVTDGVGGGEVFGRAGFQAFGQARLNLSGSILRRLIRISLSGSGIRAFHAKSPALCPAVQHTQGVSIWSRPAGFSGSCLREYDS